MGRTRDTSKIFTTTAQSIANIDVSSSLDSRIFISSASPSSGNTNGRIWIDTSTASAPVLQTYGSGTGLTKPTIDILQIRIDNGCQTPKFAGQMVVPFSAHDDVWDIINPAVIAGVPPGAGALCSNGETNEEGTYLGLDYSEFSFIVDYRLDPGFIYAPGRYELSIKFCLTER